MVQNMAKSVSRGKKHKFWGMNFDFSKKGFVEISMDNFIQNIVEDLSSHQKLKSEQTPASATLFTVDESMESLDQEKARLFHHFTAKLLYLSKRARPDISTAVAFLTTRVLSPDVEDWKKLSRCISYLKSTKELHLKLEADNLAIPKWWVDASYAVHPTCRSHTGGTL